jgi:hydantoinase/carbamoylase family amidase
VDDQLAADLDALARFGDDGAGGVSRLAWSPVLLDASRWLIERARDIGLDASLDAAGNVIARSPGSGPAIVVGSHIDTVPRGGRFDGALGVLCGLAALRTLAAEGFEPSRRPVWLVSFMDEEGARFGTPMFGSRAFAGEDLVGLGARRDGDGVSITEAMEAAGLDFDRIGSARAIEQVDRYLELHIEQGPVLEAADLDVGVVTHISGSIDVHVRFTGAAGHAGTTPMDARRDALLGAGRLIALVREEACAADVRATVGTISVTPGASNVIPATAELTVDVRATEEASLDRFAARLAELAGGVAAEERLEFEVAETARLAPLSLSSRLQEVLVDAAREAGASWTSMPSGAAHDAMVIGRHVPAAMLFVPSRGGVSHSGEEHTTIEQCSRGCEVLTCALRALACGDAVG